MNIKKTEQSSEGDKSPVIQSKGDVSIHYHPESDNAKSHSKKLYINIIIAMLVLVTSVWTLYAFYFSKANSQVFNIINNLGDVNITNNQGLSEEEVSDLLIQAMKQGLGKRSEIENQQLLDRLTAYYLSQIDLKDKTITDLENELEGQGEKVAEILSDQSVSHKIKDLIGKGNIKEADISLERQYEQLDTEEHQALALAQVLYEKGRIYELKLKYDDALDAYIEAAKLQPKNTNYLNQAQTMLHELELYDKVIGVNNFLLTSDLDKCLNLSYEQMKQNRENNVCSRFDMIWNYRGLNYYVKSPCVRQYEFCERDDQCCGGMSCGADGKCKPLSEGESCSGAIGCAGGLICRDGEPPYVCFK